MGRLARCRGRTVHRDRRGYINRLRARLAANTNHSESITRKSAISAAATGLLIAKTSSPTVARSSQVETTIFETGPGLAFIRVREPAFSGMRQQRRAASEQEAPNLPCQIAPVDDRHRKQRAAGRADHRMDSIPRTVHPSNLVGKKLCQSPNCGRDDPVVGKYIQRAQLVRERQPAGGAPPPPARSPLKPKRSDSLRTSPLSFRFLAPSGGHGCQSTQVWKWAEGSSTCRVERR